MKKVFLYLFAALCIHSAAQSSKEKKSEIYTITEEMPEYPGGAQEMMKFIQTNIAYPELCREKKLGGKVFVKFVVNADGKIKDAAVIKGSGIAALDEEALRVVNTMPQWKPGKMDNKPVNVYFNLPLSFNMPDPYFVFNANNKNENYINAKNMLEAGDKQKALTYLTQNDLKNDLDALYNLGVIYFWGRDKENSCKCFNAIIEDSKKKENTKDQQSTILTNSQKFAQYCN
jgi:TonB family protein